VGNTGKPTIHRRPSLDRVEQRTKSKRRGLLSTFLRLNWRGCT
jgi:hypothetical protein